MIEVTLFRNFSEDRRTSMEIYADHLLNHLREFKQDKFKFNEYRPAVSGLTRLLTDKANLRMRTARYIDYPVQARKQKGTVNHILDHGYAHLLRMLDPEKTVITVHDIIPLLAGRGKINGIKKDRKRWLSEYSARFYKNAGHIIAVSENTKRDLVTYCNCNPESITVIYQGINPTFKPINSVEKNELRKILGLPQKKSILILITGQEYYKNQSASLKVIECLYKKYGTTIKLVRLGRENPEWNSVIAAHPQRDQISNIDYLSSEDMLRLYNSVDCLLFPSWYEGFGLPPVEAMACGTPVVTSNVASLPEAVGDAGLMESPEDIVGLANSIEKLIEDGDFREKKIQEGLSHVRKFDWHKNAVQTLAIYKEVLN